MKRNNAIDILRGLGIFAIIFIHVTNWYAFDGTAKLISNWGQFSVPVFVFCSTYLFFLKKLNYEQGGFFNYVWKRLKRLLIPYYFFLVFYFPVVYLAEQKKLTGDFIFQNITLSTTGNDLSWAVLLFLYMFLITLFLIFSWRRFKPLFAAFAFFSLAFSILFLVYKWPFNYKTIMWLPWTLMILFSWIFAKFENTRWFFPVAVGATGAVFLLTTMFNYYVGRSLIFVENKYPPNLYYLAYGMFATAVIYWLAKKGVFKSLEKPINYLSLNSYNIFFIHLWLIIAFTSFMDIHKLAWWQFFLLICFLTWALQSLYNLAKKRRVIVFRR